jgi:biotin transport system substrate-specific component
MFIGNLIIYIFGVPVLAWHLRETTPVGRVLVIGLVNFLAGDALKIAIAALLVPVGWKVLAFLFNRKQKSL